MGIFDAVLLCNKGECASTAYQGRDAEQKSHCHNNRVWILIQVDFDDQKQEDLKISKLEDFIRYIYWPYAKDIT